jgi:adenosylmethionine-8-amino-7-oxononanoate aminotransferase
MARSTPTQYLKFYDQYLDKATVGSVAGFVLEPIQGWGGSVMPPDDFFPKLRKFCDDRKILLMADEVLTSWGRTGKWLCHGALGRRARRRHDRQGLRQRLPRHLRGRPRAVQGELREHLRLEQLRRQPDGLRGRAHLHPGHRGGKPARARRPTSAEIALAAHGADEGPHKIVGDVRAKGCLMGIELVKDRATKEPFDKAGTLVYQKAFRKGLAWIPAGHILRMSPPIVMDEATLN